MTVTMTHNRERERRQDGWQGDGEEARCMAGRLGGGMPAAKDRRGRRWWTEGPEARGQGAGWGEPVRSVSRPSEYLAQTAALCTSTQSKNSVCPLALQIFFL